MRLRSELTVSFLSSKVFFLLAGRLASDYLWHFEVSGFGVGRTLNGEFLAEAWHYLILSLGVFNIAAAGHAVRHREHIRDVQLIQLFYVADDRAELTGEQIGLLGCELESRKFGNLFNVSLRDWHAVSGIANRINYYRNGSLSDQG